MISPRHALPVAGLACAAGVTAVGVASGAPERLRPLPAAFARPPVPACVPLVAVSAAGALRRLGAARPVLPAAPGPSTAPRRTVPAPSPRLLDAFGVLRRPRAAGDALPQDAVRRLQAAGAAFDPAAARLIRTTPRGGRAWVVPVADVGPLDCGAGPAAFLPLVPGAPPAPAPRPGARVPPVVLLAPGAAAPAPRPVYPARSATVPARPATPLPGAAPARPAPLPARPARPSRVPPAVLVRPGPPPAVARALRPRPALPAAARPREGVVVVAVGDAPSGGGGALTDLLRARATPAVERCSGPGGRLVAVSGLVPDGIAEAFLTAPDGTAIKATVRGNAYAFVVAPDRTAGPRYVVWTKGGLPQVTAVSVAGPLRGERACPPAQTQRVRVSPGGPVPWSPVVLAAGPARVVPLPARLRRPRPAVPTPRLRAPRPAPAPTTP